MEQHHDPNTMLQFITQPAFLVQQGLIAQVNAAAAACLLQPGQEFAPLLITGKEEYADLTDGSLYVTISLSGVVRDACVTHMDGTQLVTVEEARTQEKLQVLALAATVLRKPMDGLMALADQFLPVAAGDDEGLQQQAALMNRRLYQMLRAVGNMSDAAAFTEPVRMEPIEICSFFEEILQKVVDLSQELGIRLTFDIPREPIFTLADTDKLERAVLNQLSNAIKFAVKDSEVQFRLTKKGQRLYISVSNCPADPLPIGDFHNRFLRAPGLEDPKNGIGLGMLLMHNTATIHEGAVLMENTADRVRVTMSLPIKRGKSSSVRSPIFMPDYAGERDHSLVELSEILPAEAYRPNNLK